MFTNVEEYLKPANIREAFVALEHDREHTMLVSGGTNVALMESSRIKRIVDIRNLGLDDVQEKNGEIHIGAAISIENFRRNPIIRERFGDLFYDGFSLVGSWQIRNMATMGGSIASRVGWSDIATCLLAVGAELEVYDKFNSDRMTLTEYVSHPLKERGIITHIVFKQEDYLYAFERIAKTSFDIATLNLGLALKIVDTKVDDIRLICGSRPQFASSMVDVEEELKGKVFNNEFVKELKSLVFEYFKGGSNIIATEEYRRHLSSILAERAALRIGGMI